MSFLPQLSLPGKAVASASLSGIYKTITSVVSDLVRGDHV